MTNKADGAPDETPPDDLTRGNGRSIGPCVNSPQVTEDAEQQPESTIPTGLQELQDVSDPVTVPLSVIVMAVLDFFRPTLFSSSWVPWWRAMLAVAVLTVGTVAVVLAMQLT